MPATVKRSGVTAKDALARQRGRVEPEENPTAGIDVTSFMMDVVSDQNLDVNIAECVTEGSVTRTMDGASHVDVTVHDPTRGLLNSGILEKTIDLTFNSRHFRLAQNQKQGGDLPITFEDRIIAMLRDKDDPRTGSRGKMTRAQFIRMLVKSVKKEDIAFFCPELHKIQPIDSPKDDTERKKRKQPGLEKSELLRVNGVIAKKEQVDNAEKILDTGYHMRASRKVLVSAIMCAMDESSLINVKHGDKAGPDSTGLFQQRDSWGPRKVREDPVGSSKLYYKVAIALDKAHPDWKLWELVWAVQFPAYRNVASGHFPIISTRYDKFKNEAKKFVEQYGATGGDTSFTRRTSYQFTVGPPDGPKGENYWEAIVRLAEEVGWRAFVSNNTFYYCSDDYLIKQKPRYTLSEETPGVEAIDFDVDKGKINDEVTVTCRADRWTAPAGSVVQLEKCGIANGKWLVWQIERNIFSYDATITLHRKQAKKKEPATDIQTVATDGSDEGIVVGGRVVTGDKIREKIVAAAKLALKNNKDYAPYSHWRPTYPQKWPSLFSKSTKEHGMDCSAFVEMVYMAAGAQDPMGLDYFGGGWTVAQRANGTKTAHPQPGDLVFYGPGALEHVAIYIGDGEVIGAGSTPTPHKGTVNGHAGFLGYWTYRLAKHTHRSLPTDPPAGNPGRN